MRIRRALVLAAAAVLGTVGAGVVAAPAHAVDAVTLNATIALNNCSASLVRYPTSVDSDRAMMLTNGHCYEGGFINNGVVLQNRASTRSGTLLNSAGNNVGTVRADQVIYATMTGTDVTLYRLNETYSALRTRTGVTALTISSSHPADGNAISIPSELLQADLELQHQRLRADAP